MDRRLIRERISRLKKELADVERHRELLRSQRNQSGMKVAALVGYTSAGKSSIENALTNAGILEDAMLFLHWIQRQELCSLTVHRRFF